MQDGKPIIQPYQKPLYDAYNKLGEEDPAFKKNVGFDEFYQDMLIPGRQDRVKEKLKLSNPLFDIPDRKQNTFDVYNLMRSGDKGFKENVSWDEFSTDMQDSTKATNLYNYLSSKTPEIEKQFNGAENFRAWMNPATTYDEDLQQLYKTADSINELLPPVESFDDVAADTVPRPTIGKYISELNRTSKELIKKPEDIGLPPDIDINLPIHPTKGVALLENIREKKKLIDKSAENRQAYEKAISDKVKEDEINKGSSTAKKWVMGTIKRINNSAATFLETLDAATNIMIDILPESFVSQVDKEFGGSHHGFQQMADAIRENDKGLPEMPNTVAANVAGSIIDIAPLFMELAITPEVSLAGMSMKLPVALAGSGFVNTYADKEGEEGQVLSSIEAAAQGLQSGLVLSAIGYNTEVLGKYIDKSSGSSDLGVLTAAGASGLGFGGLTAVDEFAATGDVDMDKVKKSFLLGATLELKSLPFLITTRALNKYASVSENVKRTINDLDVNILNIREQAAQYRGEAARGRGKEKIKNNFIATTLDAMADVKAIGNLVKLGKYKVSDYIHNTAFRTAGEMGAARFRLLRATNKLNEIKNDVVREEIFQIGRRLEKGFSIGQLKELIPKLTFKDAYIAKEYVDATRNFDLKSKINNEARQREGTDFNEGRSPITGREMGKAQANLNRATDALERISDPDIKTKLQAIVQNPDLLQAGKDMEAIVSDMSVEDAQIAKDYLTARLEFEKTSRSYKDFQEMGEEVARKNAEEQTKEFTHKNGRVYAVSFFDDSSGFIVDGDPTDISPEHPAMIVKLKDDGTYSKEMVTSLNGKYEEMQSGALFNRLYENELQKTQEKVYSDKQQSVQSAETEEIAHDQSELTGLLTKIKEAEKTGQEIEFNGQTGFIKDTRGIEDRGILAGFESGAVYIKPEEYAKIKFQGMDEETVSESPDGTETKMSTWTIGKQTFDVHTKEDGSMYIPFDGKDFTKAISKNVDLDNFDVVPDVEIEPIPGVPEFAKVKTREVVKGVSIKPKSIQNEKQQETPVAKGTEPTGISGEKVVEAAVPNETNVLPVKDKDAGGDVPELKHTANEQAKEKVSKNAETPTVQGKETDDGGKVADDVKTEEKKVEKPEESKKKEAKKESALVKQYNDIKKKYPDAIVLFRVNDFYEVIGKDAENVSKVLGIPLTKTKDGDMLTGFDANMIDTYLSELVKAGNKVALVDQLDEPPGKNSVKRNIPIVKDATTKPQTPVEQDAPETKIAKADKHNRLVDLVKDYNKLSPAKKRSKAGTAQFMRIYKIASELGYTVGQDRKRITVTDNDKPIKRIAERTSKEEINKHKGLKDYPDDFQEFVNVMATGINNLQGITFELAPLSTKQKAQAVKNILEGKKSVAANQLLDQLEIFFDAGEVEFVENVLGETQTMAIPIEDIYKSFNDDLLELEGQKSEMSKEDRQDYEDYINNLLQSDENILTFDNEDFTQLFLLDKDEFKTYLDEKYRQEEAPGAETPKGSEEAKQNPARSGEGAEQKVKDLEKQLKSLTEHYNKANSDHKRLRDKLENSPEHGGKNQSNIFGEVAGSDVIDFGEGDKGAKDAVSAAKKKADQLRQKVSDLAVKLNDLKNISPNQMEFAGDVFKEHNSENKEQDNENTTPNRPKQEPRPAVSGNRGVGEQKERPPIVTATKGEIPTPEEKVSKGSYPIDEEQRFGANLALSSFVKGDNFVLADGTGVGKTRIMLATADNIAKKGGKVLIISQNKQILENNFAKDAKAMGVDMNNFEFASYDDIRTKKNGMEEYDLVIFDEAHNLKNQSSLKTIASNNIDTKNKMFVTATPMDTPSGAVYFVSEVTGQKPDDVYRQLGFSVKTDPKTGAKTITIAKGVNVSDVRENIIRLRDEMIKRGTLLRREYPFHGDINESSTKLSPEQKAEENQILDYWEEQEDAARNENGFIPPKKLMSLRGQRSGELSRWNEAQKVDQVFTKALQNIKDGKKVVIIAEGINPTEIKGLGKDVPGFIGEIEKRFAEAGIKTAKIYGNNDKSEANKEFQDGDVQVVIGTPVSASTGIDLDDQIGGNPRKMYVVTPNYSGNIIDQMLGRVSRRNTKSPAEVEFVYTESASDNRRKEIVDNKLQVLRAIQKGEINDEIDLSKVQQEQSVGDLTFEPISERAFVVRGNTYAIKDKLKELGGKWNGKERAWMFPKGRMDEIKRGLGEEIEPKAMPAKEQPQSENKQKEPWEMTQRDWNKSDEIEAENQDAIEPYGGPVLNKETQKWVYEKGRDKDGNLYFREINDKKEPTSKWYSLKKTGRKLLTKDEHNAIVEQALKEGKPVPEEVLKDYPDLKPKEESKSIRERVKERAKEVNKMPQFNSGHDKRDATANPQKGENKPSVKIDDFGEKIEGAKKDTYKRIEKVSDEEIASQPLSKSFPKPDFAKMVQDGAMTEDGAMIIKFLYDEIPSKPRKKYRIKRWAEKVQQAIDSYNSFLKDKGNAKKFKDALGKSNEFGNLADKFFEYEAVHKALGFPKENTTTGAYRILKPYSNKGEDRWLVVKGHYIVYESPTIEGAASGLKGILNKNKGKSKGVKLNIYKDKKNNKYFIGKKGATGVVRLIENIETLKEAREVFKSQQEQLQELWDSMKLKPKERRDSNKGRVGTDYREGKNITPEEFQSEFGFRGVQFGNWVNNKERQQALNDTYDALMDLSNITGISPKALSLNGELGMAFGARGSGDASAHYESGQVVINITKTKGAGSLAHEWWHALDSYFSRTKGAKNDFLTRNPKQGVKVDNGKVVPDTRIRKEMADAFGDVVNAIKESKLPDRSEQLDKTRSNRYWSDIIEMSARSFENYVIEKLGQTNEENDYLANFKETSQWLKSDGFDMNNYPYPLKDESPAINDSFDNFFEVIEEKTVGDNQILFTSNNKFTSPTLTAIGRIKQEKASPDQMKAMLLKNGAKQVELDWMGWDEFVKDKKSITKAEVQDWIESNKVELEEVVKDDETRKTLKIKESAYHTFDVIDSKGNILNDIKDLLGEPDVDVKYIKDKFLGEIITKAETINKLLEGTSNKKIKGETKQEMTQRVLDNIASKAPSQQGFIVAKSADELNLTDAQRRIVEEAKPPFFQMNGVMYAITDNFNSSLNSPSAITEAWLHESGFHAGIRVLLENRIERKEFFEKVFDDIGQERIKEVLAEVVGEEMADHILNNSDKDVIGEEYMAYLAQKVTNKQTLTPKERSWWKKFLDWIRSRINKIMKSDTPITEEQVVDIVNAAVKSNFIKNDTPQYRETRRGAKVQEPSIRKTAKDTRVNKGSKEVKGQPRKETGKPQQDKKFIGSIIKGDIQKGSDFVEAGYSYWTSVESNKGYYQAFRKKPGGKVEHIPDEKYRNAKVRKMFRESIVPYVFNKPNIRKRDIITAFNDLMEDQGVSDIVDLQSFIDDVLEESRGLGMINDRMGAKALMIEAMDRVINEHPIRFMSQRKDPKELKDQLDFIDKNQFNEEDGEIVEEAPLKNPDRMVGDLLEEFDVLKDEWIGNMDVESTKATIAAHLQQKALKKAAEKGVDWKDVDKAIHIALDIQGREAEVEYYRPELSKDQLNILDIGQELIPEQEAVKAEIRKMYDEIGQLSVDEGIIQNTIESYVNRIYKSKKTDLPATEVWARFNTTTRHSKQRKFSTILDAWANGFELAVEGATNNLAILRQEINNVIQNKKFIEKGLRTINEDGLPMFSTFRREGYEQIKHPSFRKWVPVKKVNTSKAYLDKDLIITKDGAVLRRMPVYAPAPLAKRMNNILDVFNPPRWLKGIAVTNAMAKSTLLSYSFFHPLAFARSFALGGKIALKHLNLVNSYHDGIRSAEAFSDDFLDLVRGGMTVGTMQDWDEVMIKQGNKLSRLMDKHEIPKSVKDKLVALHDVHTNWIFKELGAGLKIKLGILHYNQLRKKYPHIDDKVLARYVGKFMNADFGGLHFTRMERSKKAQFTTQLLMLARDWTESNFLTAVRSLGYDYTEPKGKRWISKEEASLYRGFWLRAFIKGGMTVAAMNLLLALWDDPEDKETYSETVHRRFKKAWDAGNLNWLSIDVTPIYRGMTGDTTKRKYLNLLGHFLDVLKWIDDIANPESGTLGVKTLKHKSSVIAKTALEFMTGEDWRGRRFTSVDELLGVDDKGVYIVSNKETGVRVGDPKGGKHKGEFTKWDIGVGSGPVKIKELPSFMLSQLRGVIPIPINNAISYAQGEKDGFDAVMTGVGFHTNQSRIKGEELYLKYDEVKKKLRFPIRYFNDAVSHREMLKARERNTLEYQYAVSLYEQVKLIEQMRVNVESELDNADEDRAAIAREQMEELMRNLIVQYEAIEKATKKEGNK